MRLAISIFLALTATASASLGAAQEAVPSPNAVPQWRRTLAQVDLNRLITDPAYLRQVRDEIERAAPSAAGDPIAESWLDAYRAAVEAVQERREESVAAIRRSLGRAIMDPGLYELLWAAAQTLGDPPMQLEVLETAFRDASAADRLALYRIFEVPEVLDLRAALNVPAERERFERLSDILVEAGWPGESDPQAGDIFRATVINRHGAAGRRAEAVQVARLIAGPESTIAMLVMRQFHGIHPRWSSPEPTLTETIARYDRTTRDGLQAQPRNYRRILLRARFLRALGREADALALLQPLTNDVAATAAEGLQGALLVTEAAYALVALDRGAEAVALMARLTAPGARRTAGLTSANVHNAVILWQVGRAGESLAAADRMLTSTDLNLTGYSRAWLRSIRICALAQLGREADAAATINELGQQGGIARPALMHAYLCTNRLDDAERLAIERLRDGEGDVAIAMQDHRPGGSASGASAIVFERLVALRRRPAVAAALDRAARILPIPLARISYNVL